MWSFNRRSFLIATAALAGCGFTPVYGPNGTGNRLRGQIAFDAPDTTDTYVLVRYLEDRMGVADAPAYGLGYALSVTEEGLAVTSSQVIARYNVLGEMSYSLRDLSDDAVIVTGKVSAMSGYSTTGSTVATRAARSDARERLMVMLADRMIDQLTAKLPGDAE